MDIKPKLISIAGGSGTGKSTICYKLLDDYPDLFEVINLDDYQKKNTEPNLPMINGKINWDHPDIIDWQKLLNDVRKLQGLHVITIEVWSHRSNPDYHKHGQMIERSIYPKPYLLLEGYMALYHKELNKLYVKKYYLDLDEVTRKRRRGKNEVIGDIDYVNQVLTPMHNAYVEPTKGYADETIDVNGKSVDDIAEYIYRQVVVLA